MGLGQVEQLDRIAREYPELNDDDLVRLKSTAGSPDHMAVIFLLSHQAVSRRRFSRRGRHAEVAKLATVMPVVKGEVSSARDTRFV